MLKHFLTAFLIVVSATACSAQESWKIHQPKLTPQQSGTTQLLISVSPVDSRVVWAAGTGGTYVVTTDGGRHCKAAVVPQRKTIGSATCTACATRSPTRRRSELTPRILRFTRPLTVARIGRFSSRTKIPSRSTISLPSLRRILASVTRRLIASHAIFTRIRSSSGISSSMAALYNSRQVRSGVVDS